MSLSKEQRRAIVATQEGTALSSVGQYGLDQAAEFARCQIDGLFNAVIRIEGAEVASRFAFALADRIAGGLREPTEAILVNPAPALDIVPPAPRPPLKPFDPRSRYWWGMLHGALGGIAAALYWLAYRGHI
jgi:hypothetical protein